MPLSIEKFGLAPDDQHVERVWIENGGSRAAILSWGASLQDFRIPEVSHPVILGSHRFEDYLDSMQYFGAVIGPVANRIANGRVSVAGQTLDLERNENGETFLHGGTQGSAHRNWNFLNHAKNSCTLSLALPEGAGGIPGPMTLTTTYSLDQNGGLHLNLAAESEVHTLCNLAHHPYWNLAGSGSIASHQLWINAASYLPVDEALIPRGQPAPVRCTDFDYLSNASPKRGNTLLDHNFCLDGIGFREVCRLSHDELVLKISTDAPGLQVYHGADLDTPAGLTGAPYGNYAGIAIEPQYWPDAPNQAGYPSIELRPGERFEQHTNYEITKQ